MGEITKMESQVRIPEQSLLAMGTGLIALDIVEGKSVAYRSAGGSCGNVMAMLAWLGWEVRPFGRIGKDVYGDCIIQEFESLNIKSEYLIRDKLVATPVIIQHLIETAEGEPSHRFSLTCPSCGIWLPRFRAGTILQAASILMSDIKPNVFYFDRVTPASVRLAQWARDKGAIVLFEPSSVGKDKLFRKAVDLCNVLKYSYDQLGHIEGLQNSLSPNLIIETHGKKGLCLRWLGNWSKLPSFPTSVFTDASGSGDWCSAGFLHFIGMHGQQNFLSLKKDEVTCAIEFGQALATLNCQFDGARGMMNFMSIKSVYSVIDSIIKKNKEFGVYVDKRFEPKPPIFLCNRCGYSHAKGGKQLTMAA